MTYESRYLFDDCSWRDSSVVMLNFIKTQTILSLFIVRLNISIRLSLPPSSLLKYSFRNTFMYC